MPTVTFIVLRICAGLGIVLLLVGCGMIFMNWRDSWISRLVGLVIALAGLAMALVFVPKFHQHQQSVELFRNLQFLRSCGKLGGALMLLGGCGAFGMVKGFQTKTAIRILGGLVAILGLILFLYYAVFTIKLYL